MAWHIIGLPLDDAYQPVFRWRERPPGYASTNISCGSPVAPADVPTVAEQTTEGGPLPDFIRIKGALAATAAFRDIVNRLEPGVHQFFPIKLYDLSGQQIKKDFFLANVCQKVEALIIEKSNVYWNEWEQKLPDGRVLHGKNLSISGSPIQLTLRKQDINGHHLWRADRHLANLLFCSDDLMRAIQSAGLRQLDSVQAAEE